MGVTFIVQQLINGISKGSVYALIAVGFALIFSVLKFSNFAHGGMISISAFIGYYFAKTLGLGLVLSVVAAAIGGGIIGIILDTIGFYNLRKRKSPRIFYFVSSITCGILFMNILTILFGTTYYSMPPFFDNPVVKLGELRVVTLDAVILGTCIALLFVLMVIIQKTETGTGHPDRRHRRYHGDADGDQRQYHRQGDVLFCGGPGGCGRGIFGVELHHRPLSGQYGCQGVHRFGHRRAREPARGDHRGVFALYRRSRAYSHYRRCDRTGDHLCTDLDILIDPSQRHRR